MYLDQTDATPTFAEFLIATALSVDTDEDAFNIVWNEIANVIFSDSPPPAKSVNIVECLKLLSYGDRPLNYFVLMLRNIPDDVKSRQTTVIANGHVFDNVSSELTLIAGMVGTLSHIDDENTTKKMRTVLQMIRPFVIGFAIMAIHERLSRIEGSIFQNESLEMSVKDNKILLCTNWKDISN